MGVVVKLLESFMYVYSCMSVFVLGTCYLSSLEIRRLSFPGVQQEGCDKRLGTF